LHGPVGHHLDLGPVAGRRASLAPFDCYGGTYRLLAALHAKGRSWWISSIKATPRLRRRWSASRLVWIETPSNPLLRIVDIRADRDAAHAAGALVVVDNTFLSPIWQQPLALGADLVMHSTTKYLNGHSDVVGGAVIAADEELQGFGWWANAIGVTGAPFDSFMTLRGVRSPARAHAGARRERRGHRRSLEPACRVQRSTTRVSPAIRAMRSRGASRAASAPC
jgi:cystathionine beta-lyase/cystathionine gamma-synthase